jgi:hypothetical protein
MRKIRIKNFGPIQEGLLEGDGFLVIPKVTVFTGNQATGKSSVAKLISVFTWLEKALFRGTITNADLSVPGRFVGHYCHYQGIKDYFREDTEIEYIGNVYIFHYKASALGIGSHQHNPPYKMPKIMYVPAERNFLSSVSRPGSLKGLPSPLYEFLEEYELAQDELSESLELPINRIEFEYQKQSKTAFVKGTNYRLRLNEASSGLQSAVPLFLVSRNLALSIERKSDGSKVEMSLEDNVKLKQEMEQILLNDKLTIEFKQSALEVLASRYKNGCFINIVEEMEQNLYPTSQMSILFSLLHFANLSAGNGLVLTTHSPYVLNYLSIAIKAGMVLSKINQSNPIQDDLAKRLHEVVPTSACIAGNDVAVYEMQNDGSIQKLPSFNGILSDRNELNQLIDEANQIFDRLLDIEEAI